MNGKTECVKISVSLPADLWNYARNQKTNSGITVPVSRVIAFALERMMQAERRTTKTKTK